MAARAWDPAQYARFRAERAQPFNPFVARDRERLLPQLDGTRPYFFPFKRVLAWAQR